MPDKFRCELISWSQVYTGARRLGRQLRQRGFQPDVIVAVGRGGYVPARLLADQLGVMDLTGFRIEHYTDGPNKQPQARVRFPLDVDIEGLKVLLVDDVSDSGDTLELALEHLAERHPAEVVSAVLHHKASSTTTPDLYGWKVLKWHWIIYPWAMVEDVAGLIGRMNPAPTDLRVATRRLAEDHTLRVPQRVVEDAWRLMRP